MTAAMVGGAQTDGEVHFFLSCGHEHAVLLHAFRHTRGTLSTTYQPPICNSQGLYPPNYNVIFRCLAFCSGAAPIC